jgi:hypothetical protein
VTGASWAVSGAGVVVWALCWTGLRHYRHLPVMAHRWVVRAAIAFAYIAGCAVALTALGSYVLDALGWVLGTVGGPQSAGAHTAVTVVGLFLAASVIVALVWLPDVPAAYLAAAAPLVLALSGGHLHGLLSVVPAGHVVTAISAWLGGR